MKICTRCKKEKTINEFNFKIKALGLRQYQCKECTRLFVKNHYNKNRNYYLKKALKRNNNVRVEVVSFLRSYLLKHPCIDCGETDLAVLEFDHTDKIKKLKAVSTLIRFGFPLDKIKEEVDKCVVRCANCHRRKTAKDFKWLKVKMPL